MEHFKHEDKKYIHDCNNDRTKLRPKVKSPVCTGLFTYKNHYWSINLLGQTIRGAIGYVPEQLLAHELCALFLYKRHESSQGLLIFHTVLLFLAIGKAIVEIHNFTGILALIFSHFLAV